MSNLLKSMFHKTESARFNQNDWAELYMQYAGNSYPLGQSGFQANANSEPIGNDFDSYANNAYKASAVVFACVSKQQSVMTEIRFQYRRMNKGRPGDIFGVPQLSLLENPWPNGQTADLVAHAIADFALAGNHYVVTEGAGASARLRRLHPGWTDILLTAAPNEARKSDVAGYLYRPGDTQDQELWEVFPIDGSNGTVAHWAPIPDPSAQYRGMSWITPILNEVKADKAMIKHKLKFFDNGASPQVIVGFAESVDQEQLDKFTDRFNRSHQGVDNAYKTLFLGGGADAKVVGTSLREMDFVNTGGHGETRICAAAGIPPVLVGLAENLHGSTLNAGNYQAAKDMWIDSSVRPLWRSLCQAYSVLMPTLKNAELWYDDRDISFLRADRLAVSEIGQTSASTISAYVMAGFTPDSAVAAVVNSDPTLLEHTGLTSVQLFPLDGTVPGQDENTPGQPDAGANKPDAADGGPAAPNAPGADGAQNAPNKPGRPPKAAS